MFTYIHIKVWFLLTTTFLLVITHALPSEICIKISASSAYVDTNIEYVLHIPRLLHDHQPIFLYVWEIFISTATVIAVFSAGKWCGRRWRASQRYPLPHAPRRSYSVLAGAPILDDVPLCQPPLEEIHDTRHVVQRRGKSSTTAWAPDSNPPRRNALQEQAILHRVIEEYDPDPGDNDIPPVEAPAIFELLLEFLKRLLASVTLRWIQLLRNLPSDPSQARPVLITVASRSSSLPNPRRIIVTIQPRSHTLAQGTDIPLPYPIETEGLNKSLNTGSKDLSAQNTGNLSVLFVAAADGLRDPKHDLGVFQGILHQPIADPAMRFSSLADSDVTIETIRRWFIWLYLLAFLNRAKLLVFLAGRGNERNRMCLLEKASLDGDDIHEWLSTIRKRFNLRGAHTPTIIIDICREYNIPSFNPGTLVNLIRSCSPCQFAQAIGFESEEVSRSCFYLAFFLAANDGPPTPTEFKNSLRRWLDHVSRLRLWIYDYWHAVPRRCEDCVSNGVLCDRPGPQTLEEGYAGWPDLYRLGMFIVANNPNAVHVIVNTFMQDMRATGLWVENISPPSAPQSSRSAPIVQPASAVTSHPRGAILPVSQAESATPRNIVGE